MRNDMPVNIEDNSEKIKARMDANVKRALTAMGHVGVESVIDQMNTGYGKPIYQTGQLQRDIKFRTDEAKQEVYWGVLMGDLSASYAALVHNGTRGMVGRPFLRDGLLPRAAMLRETAKMYLKEGFDGS